MKKNIHPDWNHDCTVTCSCGHTFTTGSTQKTLQVDICSKCHPFFTGEERFVDRQGRVDKFKQKMKAAQTKKAAAQKAKKSKQGPDDQKKPESYQDILRAKRAELRKSSKEKKAPATDKKS